MLDFSNSFFLQHWEFLVIFISIAYFVVRLRDNRNSSRQVQKINDDETIEKDAGAADEVDLDDLAPALENVDHVPFRGATKVLKGGVHEFFEMANDRRSIRKFSRKHVDIEIVKKCIQAAGTAPSGAHTEPWSFCLVKR
jgi:iodotyrosine deiodinase